MMHALERKKKEEEKRVKDEEERKKKEEEKRLKNQEERNKKKETKMKKILGSGSNQYVPDKRRNINTSTIDSALVSPQAGSSRSSIQPRPNRHAKGNQAVTPRNASTLKRAFQGPTNDHYDNPLMPKKSHAVERVVVRGGASGAGARQVDRLDRKIRGR